MAAEPEPIPKGPTSYPIESMPPEDFEAMCSRLVRIEHGGTVATAPNKDGGADDVLPDGNGGYARCWQHKHMPSTINWTNLEESFAAAKKNWAMPHYTFTFPKNLTHKEQQAFDKRFRGPGETVKVDYVGYQELQALLTGSAAGQRVAKTFFNDVGGDMGRVVRAIEAGGKLDTPGDAMDRLFTIGGALSEADAFFRYSTATHEEGHEGPGVSPGSVLSYEKSDGTSVVRLDVVPRDDAAMERYAPEFKLTTSADEAGRRAAELLHKAVSEGTEVEVREGVEFTFTKLPPGIAEMTGKPMSGSVTIGPAEAARRPIPSWDARLTMTPVAGDARTINIALQQIDTVPNGWDDGVTGECGGLHATLLFKWREGQGGEIKANFRFVRAHAPVAHLLTALRFMQATGPGGKLVIHDRDRTSERPDLTFDVPGDTLPAEVDLLEAFLADVRAIEGWAGVELSVPDAVTPDDLRAAASVAALIQNEGQNVTWDGAEFVLDDAARVEPFRNGATLRVEHAIDANVLGRMVPLGFTRLEIADYTLASVRPEPGSPSSVRVRLEPKSEDHGLFQSLVRERTTAKPPPPPPRRKSRRRRRRTKR